MSDNEVMNGLTIDEMCKELNLPFKTVAIRIHRAGIKPMTRQALYHSDTLEKIRDVKMGRPPKAKEPEAAKGRPKKAGK